MKNHRTIEYSSFDKLQQKLDIHNVEIVFIGFLYNNGRFPMSVKELFDSTYNDEGFADWIIIKLSDPFSAKNELFKYIPSEDFTSFILLSMGPDRKFNQYQSYKLTESDKLKMLADSNCTSTTDYSGKDIIVMSGERTTMLLANSWVMENSEQYFEEMISLNKRFIGIIPVLISIDSLLSNKLVIKNDNAGNSIQISYNNYVFKYNLLDTLDVMKNSNNGLGSYSIFGVFDYYDEDTKTFIYNQCIVFESEKGQDIKDKYETLRMKAYFNLKRCNFE